MAKVQVLNVAVLDNPSPFGNPFQFEITFECMEDLPEDLEWKIIYVGSAESEEYDQVLDSVLVGPVPAGRHMFVFQADAPNTGLIPESDAVGVTVVLITCTYRGQEFIRIGYYVNNEYTDPELRENPPLKPDYTQLQRNILASNPRVTRFHINWEGLADKLEDSENVDPSPNISGMLPPSCIPGKMPPLGLMPDNSMDCIQSERPVDHRRGDVANPQPSPQLSITSPVLARGRDVRSAVVPSSRSSPRLQGANVDLGELPSLSDPAEV
ncbi:Histone chaperone asf1b-B Anti-silencing function protein 1-like protein Bb [Larimichthys crocea]|uniref:Histone chaperone asf1b-B Anti-silencing function protein 1-like protein Bb n=1 Tax=Larimichthys crocea TaxID=215358 RepID=A0A6G0JAL7_LARCR|nr:Histone chaperone asf1b-B Anti-silencing function protein 1-like protein Bb [Larimichthys crocea]